MIMSRMKSFLLIYIIRKSNEFSNSKTYMNSDFINSNVFTKSNDFTNSIKFISSNIFTNSLYFSSTKDFTQGNEISKIQSIQ